MDFLRSHKSMRPFFCKIHESLIDKIVREDKKGRFEIFTEEKEDGLVKYIKAAQGHSGRIEIANDEALTRLKPGMGWPQCCLRGTTQDHLASIIEHGLRPGGMPHGRHHQDHARQHIHFAPSWYPKKE